MKRFLVVLALLALASPAEADDFRLKGTQLRLIPVTSPDGACLTSGVCLWYDVNASAWKLRNPNQTDTTLGAAGSSYYQTIKDGDNVSATQRAILKFSSDFSVTDGSPSTVIALANTPVPNTRTISTTAPLGGGGALSGNLTLTCSTCAVLQASPSSAQSGTLWIDSSGGILIGDGTPGNTTAIGNQTVEAGLSVQADGGAFSCGGSGVCSLDQVSSGVGRLRLGYTNAEGVDIGRSGKTVTVAGSSFSVAPVGIFGSAGDFGFSGTSAYFGTTAAASYIAIGKDSTNAMQLGWQESAGRLIFNTAGAAREYAWLQNGALRFRIQTDGTSEFDGAQGSVDSALVDGATISTDATKSNVFTVTLAGDRTLANPTGLHSGFTYLFLITQDGSGSHTLSYGSSFAWPGGTAPTLTTTAGAVDMITCVYDGTKLRCVFQADIHS